MDRLTGLGSRAELAALLLAGGPEGLPGIYLNIDGFIGVNAVLGHSEGDRILAKLGRWLAAKAASLKITAFRIGGNEFLLAGPALSPGRAQETAAEIVLESQELGLPYAHPLSERAHFSVSAVVFQARSAEGVRYDSALDQLREAAYAAECREGRDFGVVGYASMVELPASSGPEPEPPVMSLQPIGWIRSSLKDRREAPKQGSEGAPDAWLELDPAFAVGLEGITGGQEIVLVTWFHQAQRDVLKLHPRGDPSLPLTGVFATRSPDRPNPLGLHRVKVLEVRGPILKVGPLEAIDGTPVVDVKPVLADAPP
jgi:tRNA-Thr(GGU) m(6)t(6)A37 methyltransferase TsaA